MKKLLRCFEAALLSAVTVLSLTGCKKDDASSVKDIADQVGDVSEADLPYGSTITQLRPGQDEGVNIMTEYDHRFLTEEEAVKINDYVTALNTCDGALLDKTVHPVYLDYLKEQNDITDSTEYVTQLHDKLKTDYMQNKDFDLNYVLVNSCLDESADDVETNFSSLDTVLDSCAAEQGKDAVSPKITSRKLVGIDIMFALEDDNSSYSLSYRSGKDQMLYIYTIDGQIYIL